MSEYVSESPAFQKYFTNTLLESMGVETERLALIRIRKQNPGATEKRVQQIYKREKAAWRKEFNRPENVAQRRIAELESQLAKTKDVLSRLINDPDSIDRD